MEDYWIPRNLNAPALLFMWEADTAMLFLVVFFLGVMMQAMLVSLIVAYLIVRVFRVIKEDGGLGLIQRVLYWYFPSDWLTERHGSHLREFVGE